MANSQGAVAAERSLMGRGSRPQGLPPARATALGAAPVEVPHVGIVPACKGGSPRVVAVAHGQGQLLPAQERRRRSSQEEGKG
ncbi:hypothetical protein GW17_00028982 [Ensete ventricosum]|nr:hypothetical protein GW17_00028982 [Ensete ventricosum]RZS19399.1 hypothetical protein BHM03_00051785 [Ensete ventricosum]